MIESDPSPAKSTTDPRERPRSTLLALVRYRDSSEVCTLFPPTVVAPQQTEAWIRATDDAFCLLEEWR